MQYMITNHRSFKVSLLLGEKVTFIVNKNQDVSQTIRIVQPIICID